MWHKGSIMWLAPVSLEGRLSEECDAARVQGSCRGQCGHTDNTG